MMVLLVFSGQTYMPTPEYPTVLIKTSSDSHEYAIGGQPGSHVSTLLPVLPFHANQ